MEMLATLAGYVAWPLEVLAVFTVIVYVHELGHYWVARWCGVRIDTFSIGFGPELFGWYNRHGTRWKVSAIPLGGYVKFFGDSSAASTPDEAGLAEMSPADRAVAFHYQRLSVRTAVVFAGPAANFLFALVVFAGLFAVFGQPFTPAVVTEVVAGGAAAEAGIMPGDKILAVDGSPIDRFEELKNYVALRAETPIDVRIQRAEATVSARLTPRRVEVPDGFGGTLKVGQIGIKAAGLAFVRRDPALALWYGAREIVSVIDNNMTYLGRVVSGRESGDQISGPAGIAKIIGDVAGISVWALVSLMATLSVGIGFVNLFPVPMLDGGHLLFYALEALRGRPLGERTQEYGFRIGLALVLSLFLFATWNDLQRLRVISFIAGLFS